MLPATDRGIVVGHNPGIHELARILCNDGDDELLSTLQITYPTDNSRKAWPIAEARCERAWALA